MKEELQKPSPMLGTFRSKEGRGEGQQKYDECTEMKDSECADSYLGS